MSLNSYQKAIINITDPTMLRILEETLRLWAIATDIGRKVVPNLMELERFLPEDKMLILLNTIFLNSGKPFGELEEAYEDECHRHTRAGGEVHSSISPTRLGKAIDKEYFINWLVDVYRGTHFTTELEAEIFIDELIKGTPLDDDDKVILLGSEYLIWATWSQDSASDDPFHFLRFNMAEEARSCLGIDKKIGGSLILLVYDKPPTLKLYRPTIADAGIFTLFQPPPLGHDVHGYTKPWDLSMLNPDIFVLDPRFRPIPRPEAVHFSPGITVELLSYARQLD